MHRAGPDKWTKVIIVLLMMVPLAVGALFGMAGHTLFTTLTDREPDILSAARAGAECTGLIVWYRTVVRYTPRGLLPAGRTRTRR